MKRTARIVALMLVIGSIFSVFGGMAFADLQTGREKYEGVSRSEANQQAIEEIYEDICYRAYLLDKDLALPNLEDMNDYDEIKIKYVQGKRGMVRGQSIYLGPDDSEPRWSVKDGGKVKVYARYRDYSFVEVMMNNKESEGTLGWIPTAYIVNKWNPAVSQARTTQYGG